MNKEIQVYDGDGVKDSDKVSDHLSGQRRYFPLDIKAESYDAGMIEIEGQKPNETAHRKVTVLGIDRSNDHKIRAARDRVFDVVRVNGQTMAEHAELFGYDSFQEHDVHGKVVDGMNFYLRWKP